MKRTTLNNGVRLLQIPLKGTKTFTFLVMVGTGSRHETRENNGISHFLEHMFFKGTKKRPNTLAISTALDKIGGEFNAFTSKEYTGYYAKVDGEHAGQAVDVIGDMLLHSKFDAREVQREKGVILEEINMYENNPIIHIDDLFESCLYGDTPLGWDTIGTRENIKRFSRKDFLAYQKSQYRGEGVVAVLSGKFGADDIAAARKLLEGLPAGAPQPAVPQTRFNRQATCVVKSQRTEQVSVSVGVRAYGYHHPDYIASKVLATVLGGSMSSRLFIAVRERQGLAYQVHTHVDAYSDTGYLTTTIGTSAATVERAVETTIKEYARIAKTLVKAEELQKAKDYVHGKTVLALESSDARANWYAKQEALGRKVMTPEEYYRAVGAVTAADIRRVAKDIFRTEGLNLAAIGNGLDKKRLREMLVL